MDLLSILPGSGEIISAWLGNQLATEKKDLFQVDLYKFRFGIIRCFQIQFWDVFLASRCSQIQFWDDMPYLHLLFPKFLVF